MTGPTIYYRGTVPGETRRISTGDPWWDGHLFLARLPEQAKSYGPVIERVAFRPGARILVADSPTFRALERRAGRGASPESMLVWAARVARQAEREGYAAVDFARDFIGTIVLDESTVIRDWTG